tara:strand:+ start:2817 stop:3779 length:963 start_codon:yes stop_codon:yes gene_type:complete
LQDGLGVIMTENDKDKDRLEKIKQEEKEDASSYYTQGDPKEEGLTSTDYEKPVDPIDSGAEEMSFLKTVAFLGFGLAALAIVFILFFIRDLDERVVYTDQKVDSTASTVAKLDEEMEPFKQEVSAKISSISANVDKLEDKVSDYERMMAIMELKRAMVTIQEVMDGSDPAVKSKSEEVVGSIRSLLGELDNSLDSIAVTSSESPAEQTLADKVFTEEEQVEGIYVEGENETEKNEEDFEETESSEKISDNDEKDIGEEDDEEGKEPEDQAEALVPEEESDTIPNFSSPGKNVGEITLAEESNEIAEGEEELPPIDELLKE